MEADDDDFYGGAGRDEEELDFAEDGIKDEPMEDNEEQEDEDSDDVWLYELSVRRHII